MTDELHVYLGDELIGQLHRDRHGRASFEYDLRWRARGDAYPLSFSMPLAAANHASAVVEPYLWGLLPDNASILEAWGKRYQVSASSAFALLRHVGADCPGAVRILEHAVEPNQPPQLEPLDEGEIAQRLRALREDHSAWRNRDDSGQFSLAGAQPKTALWFDGETWAIPSGRTPTTHILKPGILDLDGSAHNEHFCLSLMRELGLPAAETQLSHFEDQYAIVARRYDRIATADGIIRLHQEDLCQALAIHPSRKYQSDGGPTPAQIVELLREVSSAATEDIASFLDALICNWLIAGTDAHAKNYSLLIGAGGQARLAPLYDIASALPYPDFPFQKLKLAMKLGGHYRIRDITRHDFQKAARELSLSESDVLERALTLAQRLPDAVTTVSHKLQKQGATHPVLSPLQAALIRRAQDCAALLRGASS